MYKIYQVEYGDTIDIIAKKTNTTADNIKKINNINMDSDLTIGGLVIVPGDSQMMFENYTVKQGDTIYAIARMYETDVDTLLMLNGLNKTDYIYPNQEIIVPLRGVMVYVTKAGDTLNLVSNRLGVTVNELNKQNNRIFLAEDQLIVSKKE